MSHALEQTKAARIVICKSASSTPHFLLARVQFPTCFPICLSHIHLATSHLATSLYIICFLPTVFQTFCSNKRESLTGKSWEFSDISSDTPALWAHDGTSLDVNKANGMLTSNTKGIFCDNVRCFGTNKSCSKSHLQECFQYSSLLACKGTVSTCSPICLSHIHLATSLYIICFLPTVFKTFCSNKRESLTGKSWEFSDISSDTPALWAHDGTSLDVNKANGMLTSNTKGIFCDNATCFGTNKSCSNSHLQECFQYSSLLQFPTCFPICLSHIHLATSLYIICFLPTVFKTFCSNKGESLTGKSWEFSDIASDTPALWAHDGTSLDVNKANGMLTSNTKGLLRQCHMLWNKQKLLE